MYNEITNSSMQTKCHHYSENPKTAWFRVERGWVREDFDKSRSIHCLDQNDTSPAYAAHPRTLACDWCYLGYAHTEALHLKKLEE